MDPPGGSGVAAVMPARRIATELTTVAWKKLDVTMIGLVGLRESRSAAVSLAPAGSIASWYHEVTSSHASGPLLAVSARHFAIRVRISSTVSGRYSSEHLSSPAPPARGCMCP